MEYEILQELKDQIERLFSLWRRAESVRESAPLYTQILRIDGSPVSLCIYDAGHEPAMIVDGLENRYVFVAYVRHNLKFISRTPEDTAALIRNKLKNDESFLENNFDTRPTDATCIIMKRKTGVADESIWDEIVLKIQNDTEYRKRIQAKRNFATQREDLSVTNDLDYQPAPDLSDRTSRVTRTHGTNYNRNYYHKPGDGSGKFDDSGKFDGNW